MRLKRIGWILFLFGASLWGAPFTDNGNGTVTDSFTGLLWQKCSNGQNNDTSCSGTATTSNWSNAITYCEGLVLGGRSDWRLPNVNDLRSIVDYTKSSAPTINTTAFPSTFSTSGGPYWSSSTYAQDTNRAWGVSFQYGGVYNDAKTGNSYVRCVAGP